MKSAPGTEVVARAPRRDVNDRMDIIAITGLATNEQVRGIARRGVAICLRKPFDVRELLTAIARVRAATPGKT